MNQPPKLPEAEIEELQDFTALPSRDGASSAEHPYASRSKLTFSSHNYAQAQSRSLSPDQSDPIQARQDSYGLQQLVSQTRKRLSGWKTGMLLAVSADLAILVFFLALTLFTALGFSRSGSQITLVDNNCDSVRNWSTWLHLGINIISTVLLSTSSYVMQCLTSPTRKEISKAHSKGRYMDIGVPSYRNLLYITPIRAWLWAMLVLSSLPLHLLANSAVYETQGANSYVLAVVEDEFISRPLSGLSEDYTYLAGAFNSPISNPMPAWIDEVQVTLGRNTTRLLKELVPQMERLENADCMRAYSQPLVSNRRNVLAVTSHKVAVAFDTGYNYVDQIYYQSVDYCPDCQSFRYYTNPTLWLCAFLYGTNQGGVLNCNIPAAITRASEWNLNDSPIEYCLSERAEGQCQLQASLAIMIVVLICTLAKIATIITAFRMLPNDMIATVGDAVASFLRDREPQTSQCSLLSRGDVQHGRWKSGTAFPKAWSTQSLRRKWGSAPSAAQWGATILLLGALLITTIAFFSVGLHRLKHLPAHIGNTYVSTVAPTDAGSIMRMGFGVVDVNFLVTLPDMSSRSGVVRHTLLANTPQLVLSLSYFAYNSIWTHMLIAREWAQFGLKRQSLRVSLPVGQQRGNYFLTIPYQYAVPLQVISAVLHWLLSQSFFLARVNVNSAEPFVDAPPAVINTVGYSLGPLLIFFIITIVVVVTVLCFGMFMKFSSPMPIVSGCSLAISAACHPLGERGDIALVPLKWGMVKDDDGIVEKEGNYDVKHCSFSAGEVSSPAELPCRTKYTTVMPNIGFTQPSTVAMFA